MKNEAFRVERNLRQTGMRKRRMNKNRAEEAN